MNRISKHFDSDTKGICTSFLYRYVSRSHGQKYVITLTQILISYLSFHATLASGKGSHLLWLYVFYTTTGPLWFGIEAREPSLEAAAKAASLNPRRGFVPIILEAAAKAASQIEAPSPEKRPRSCESEAPKRSPQPCRHPGLGRYRRFQINSLTLAAAAATHWTGLHICTCKTLFLAGTSLFIRILEPARLFSRIVKKRSSCINVQD